jgi:hypothetical protein
MANFNIDYLVVAGGGGASGGFYNGQGGGAGGFLTNYGGSALSLETGTNYSVSIGGGGASTNNGAGVSGSDSVFASITSDGGGGGGTGSASTGGAGGSGGAGSTAGGTATSGQGNNGGVGDGPNGWVAGGGGGASAPGGNISGSGTTWVAGNGGNGLSSSITGTATTYAGGGGGGAYNYSGYSFTPGTGGTGGGGNGSNSTNGSNGTDSLGGGGGGGNLRTTSTGGSGGSGIVVLRYATADVDSSTVSGAAPTETTDGTDTILSFTTVGTGSITFTSPAIPITPFDGTRATTPVTGFDKINTTQGLKLPSGTNSNQPIGTAAEQGMIRNDTEETVDSSASAMTHYNGTNWQYFAATESPDDPNLKMNLDASNTASYPGTGTTWFDLTSNANNGTINGATWNAGGYFNFDGSNDSVTNNNISLDTSKEFSFCGWVYPTQDNVWQRLFSWGTSSTEVTVQKRGDNNKARIIARVSNSIKFDVDGAVLTNNQWYFIAVTGDGSNVKMYVNNNAAVTDNITGTNNYNNLQLGTGAGTTEYFYGQISKFNVYDKALTQAEITAIHNEGR